MKLINFLFILSIFSLIGCKNGPFASNVLEVTKNLTVSEITSESAKITWSKVDNAYCYEVYYQPEGYEAWYKIDTFKTECTLDNLFSDENYTVSVQANSDFHNNKYFPSDYAKKSFRTLVEVLEEKELFRPKNLKAEINSDKTTLTVSWEAVEDAVYYDVYLEYVLKYRGPEPDKEISFIYTVPATQTSFKDDSVPLFKKVSIKVAARNKDFSDSCRWSKYIWLENE